MANRYVQKERAITLFGSPIIIILIAVVAAAVGGFEVWWINQPAFEQPPLRLDLNTATVGELTTLPGIDQTTAEKIVSERPYNRTDDLVKMNIITQVTYDQIKDQIVAKQN